MTTFLCVLIGLASGFMGAMTGVGGALLAVPLLLSLPTLLDLPFISVHATTGLAMVQGLTTNLVGVLVHKRAGFVSSFLLRWMGSGVVFGSLLGSVASRWFPDRWLLLMISFVLLFCAFQMLRPTPELDRDFAPSSPFPFASAGFLTGVLAGATGLGTGSLTIALLVYWLKVPIRIALGSTLGISLLAAIVGTMGKALTLQVPMVEGIGLSFGAALGALWGAKVSHKISAKILRNILAIFIAIAALHALWRSLG
ncbi:MAG: sulfite exporter TauE/SafE family protein [Armatimonadetes bacterium]|nr:sulfite exporter TauE/SafE family protein [Armatimonadota bacterium]MDW8029502.1 sulfite exporter TauE/SafE family protein [Armatimonadota bacterium]